MAVGTLVVVMGRGAGRLVDEARAHCAVDARLVFPRRLSTRPVGGGQGEVYTSLTPAQFEMLRRTGGFALAWSVGGVHYALPRDIEEDAEAGRTVVAAGVPAVLPRARQVFGRVLVIDVGACGSAADLAERLDAIAADPSGPPAGPNSADWPGEVVGRS
ncbi:MAG: phosphonate metabolism protein/1,5-bisphosphokinase (PRPP-forming) PhnN [Alphaproteobacteria bacterium]|nr:phosphonate metabolism protein/1,5-bisphosphokinase (PRPP-forming) PhnN [Alphaproteobacteria bacterium]